jgi:hypothetical protein
MARVGDAGFQEPVHPCPAAAAAAPDDLVAHTANFTPERIYDVVMHGSGGLRTPHRTIARGCAVCR